MNKQNDKAIKLILHSELRRCQKEKQRLNIIIIALNKALREEERK